jgi:hypothetical protein
MIANMITSAKFINACFNFPRVSAHSCVYNMDGITEFRVPSEGYAYGAAFNGAHQQLVKVLGEATVTEFEPTKSAATWNFGQGRSLTLRWKAGEGTFARLTDMEHIKV